jgi:hypothetical protein
VLALLEWKHPDAITLETLGSKAYETFPALMDLDVTEEVCCKVGIETLRLHRIGWIGCGCHTTMAFEIW